MRWAKEIATLLDTRISFPSYPDFEAIYPLVQRGKDRLAKQETQKKIVDAIAVRWSKEAPEAVAERLIYFETEAKSARLGWPRLNGFVCGRIAQIVEKPAEWAEAFMIPRAPSELLFPFIDRAVLVDQPRGITLLDRCLDMDIYRSAGAITTLGIPSPPSFLLEKALKNLVGLAQTIEVMMYRAELSPDKVSLLLQHDDSSIAAAAAIGEWESEPKGIVRSELLAFWRGAVIEHMTDHESLSAIFGSDSTIAFEWLRKCINEKRDIFWRSEAVVAAVEVLDSSQKQQLLKDIPDDFRTVDIIRLLIGQDLELYRDLLRNERLKRYHLVPLESEPTSEWLEKALIALNSGYGPLEIAKLLFSWGDWTGNESEMWADKAKKVQNLILHPDQRVQEIGRLAQAEVENNLERAQDRERNEAVYGQ